MKHHKVLGLTLGLGGVSFIMVGCGGHSSADQAREDSIRVADSIAAVEADLAQMRADSLMRDSVLGVEAVEKYKDAVILTPGNKNKKLVPESTFYKIDWTCTLANNAGITMTPADYQVVFDETFEDGNVDGLFDVTKQRSIKGVNLPVDSTAQVVLTGRANTKELSNPAVKMLISEEDFIARYKAAHK